MDDLLVFSFNVSLLLVKDLDPLPSISWLAVDWCSQAADAVCFCGYSPSFFLRALDVSPMQCSPQPLHVMYTTPVFSGEVLSVGRTNWDLKVLQGLSQ